MASEAKCVEVVASLSRVLGGHVLRPQRANDRAHAGPAGVADKTAGRAADAQGTRVEVKSLHSQGRIDLNDALPQIGGGDVARLRTRNSIGIAQALVIEIEVGLATGQFGEHRAAHVTSEKVFVGLGPRSALPVVGPAVGVEDAALEEVETGAVECVASPLGNGEHLSPGGRIEVGGRVVGVDGYF